MTCFAFHVISPVVKQLQTCSRKHLYYLHILIFPSFGEIVPGYLLHMLQSDHRCNFLGREFQVTETCGHVMTGKGTP